MKQLFTILMFIISFQSFAQKEVWVYDYDLVREVKKSGSIDTLVAPLNQKVTYELSVNGEAGYLKEIEVTNTNGAYTYRLATGGLSWSGKTGTKLNFTIGKGIYVQIMGVFGKTIYQRTKQQL
jgi:hypothetical protein